MSTAEKRKVLYVGQDEAFLSAVKDAFVKEDILVDDFVKEHLAFSDLPKHDYSVVVIDGDFKGPNALMMIETLRASYTGAFKPYILLLGKIAELKLIKKSFTVRNHPDDLCVKDVDPRCVANHILFSCFSSEVNGDRLDPSKEVISGDLKIKPYGRLLYDLLKERFTGKLIIETLQDKAVFWFLNGEPVNIKFNRIQFTLGRLLLKRGTIDEETYLESLELMLKKNMRHGDALIQSGVLKPSDIADTIKEQYIEKLMFFFSKDSGRYLIVKEDPNASDFMNPKVDVFTIIYNGIMQFATSNLLMEKYLPHKNDYVAVTENFTLLKDNFPIASEDKIFFEHISQCPVFYEVIDKTPLEFVKILRLFEILDSCYMFNFVKTKGEAEAITQWAQPKMLEIKENIVKNYVNFKEKSYYEILGVAQNHPADQIKKKYLDLAKQYHPDKFSHLPLNGEMIGMISEIFQMIQAAYQTLSGKESRLQYDATISSPAMKEAMSMGENIINAEIAFKKGEILLKRRNYKEAESYFRQAVKLNEKETEYLVNLAMTLIFLKERNDDEKDKDARNFLERAIYLNPYNEKAYYYLGIWNKLRGSVEDAIVCFKKTISINPSNKEAVMELRSLEKF